MALNFPDAPTDGQVFDKWTYSAASGSWRLTGDITGPATGSRLLLTARITAHQDEHRQNVNVNVNGYAGTVTTKAGYTYRVSWQIANMQAPAGTPMSWYMGIDATTPLVTATPLTYASETLTRFYLASGLAAGAHTFQLIVKVANSTASFFHVGYGDGLFTIEELSP